MASDRADIQGDELPPGSILCGGQYTIDQYLNAGGFGVTYLARDSLGRRVVIKECFPSAMCFRANQTVRVRSQGNAVEFEAILELFEKEARALASLQHPYIVGVHQYFRDNDTAYMAMDFVEGRTLLDIIETDPARLTPDAVKTLLSQLLQAVNYIHRHDILHRDISPDNILIDDDNLPVLIDFGAAREDATRVSRVLSKILTVKDGYSPQEFYMAGSDQVYASDLYALAATFHHVLSGRAPASSHSRMAAAARDKPDPLTPLGRIEGYDAAFIAAINTCLNLFPKERLQTAEAWQGTIDEELRKKKLIQAAARDQNLDQTVAKLVKDFFKDFQPKRANADSESKTKAGAASQSTPDGQARLVPALLAPSQEFGLDEDAFAADLDDDLDAVEQQIARAGPREDAPLQPIEKMRLKYMKPEKPEPEPEEEPKSPILFGWIGRFGRPAQTEGKSDHGDDQAEEMA